jgi:hypothetical protein
MLFSSHFCCCCCCWHFLFCYCNVMFCASHSSSSSSCCRTPNPVLVGYFVEVLKNTITRFHCRHSSAQKYAASQLCNNIRIQNLSVRIRLGSPYVGYWDTQAGQYLDIERNSCCPDICSELPLENWIPLRHRIDSSLFAIELGRVGIPVPRSV